MALADIINRIASDASAESERELAAASAHAEELLAAARAEADARHQRTIDAARRSAASSAATVVALARLAARDKALTEKRALVAEALDGVVRAVEALPADKYVSLLAAGIAQQARSGDRVALAAADAGHLAAMQAAVRESAPDMSLVWESEPAPVERGAVVSGERSRVEITPASLVDERRGELELAVTTGLFAGEER